MPRPNSTFSYNLGNLKMSSRQFKFNRILHSISIPDPISIPRPTSIPIDSSPDYNTNARLGYYKTLWPSEMTDLYRSHCVLNGGLPVDTSNLQITTANNLAAPAFGYTRKKYVKTKTTGKPNTKIQRSKRKNKEDKEYKTTE